jgi:hypothetical protein
MPDGENTPVNDAAPTQGEAPENTPDAGGEHESAEKTLTQSEVDQLLKRRLYRERKKWEDEAAEQKKLAEMTEAERYKAEVEAVRKESQERLRATQQRIVTSEAKSAALNANVRSDRLEAVIRLADLSDVDVYDDGGFDEKAVQRVIQSVVDQYPEFTAQQQGYGNAPDASRNTRPQVDTSDPDQVRANFLNTLLGGRQ